MNPLLVLWFQMLSAVEKRGSAIFAFTEGSDKSVRWTLLSTTSLPPLAVATIKVGNAVPSSDYIATLLSLQGVNPNALAC